MTANMDDVKLNPIVFFTMVRSVADRDRACLLINSIRSFGGDMSQCPIWLFEVDPQTTSCQDLESMGIQVTPLAVPEHLRRYIFGDKVYACAQAEIMSESYVHSLIWIDPTCIIVQPPRLYELDESLYAAVRPVHIRNVGLSIMEPLDGFWQGVYSVAWVENREITVESFVDRQTIRAYFNTHAFSINPSIGLLQRWLNCFDRIVCDHEYQLAFCHDKLHQIFLHQAVFSALLVPLLELGKIRILPPNYNYPYHLQSSIPYDRRARLLNELVSLTYEDCSLDPKKMSDIQVDDPVRTWLLKTLSLIEF